MAILADEILDTLPALLISMDDSGQVIEFRASQFIDGHPQPPHLPCSPSELWPATTADEIRRAFAHLNHGQQPMQLSYKIDGGQTERHFRARMSRQEEHFLILVMDASEEIVQEGEKQLLYEQLRQNQKMEALGQLTGGIAHDFNNILGSILGYADLTLDAVEYMGEQNLARYLREVIDSGEKARDLIAQMLAFARAKPNDAISLMPAPLIKETVKMVHSALPATIRLNVNCEEELPLIRIDPAQLNQIIVNLCINARDAIGEEGAIDITLRAGREPPRRCSSCQERFEGEYVEIAVSDNGNGIDPLLMERIFDPFFTTKEFTGNSGMGLSVVHGIVHDQQGHLVVESQPGQGATIRLFFPAIVAEAESTPPRPLPKSPDIKATILVIDDEESTARLLGELLRNAGFGVEVFSDPVEALRGFRSHPEQFDLALVDQEMPGIAGLALAQEFLELRPQLPIVLNTTPEGRNFTNAAKEAGIRALLTKPIHSARLLNTVIGLLQK